MRFAPSSRIPITLAALALAAAALTAVAVASRPRAGAPRPVVAAPAAPPVVTAAAPVRPVAVPRAAKSDERVARATDAETAGTAGMRIAIDPETGEIGAARPEASAMRIGRPESDPALSHSSEGLREVVLPDGSVMVNLEGRFQESAVVEIGPDGKRRMRCVQTVPVAPQAEVLK